MEYIVLTFVLLLKVEQPPTLIAHFTDMVKCQAQAAKMSEEYEEVLKGTTAEGGAFVCLQAVPATI